MARQGIKVKGVLISAPHFQLAASARSSHEKASLTRLISFSTLRNFHQLVTEP
jgi:hypothetical protein